LSTPTGGASSKNLTKSKLNVELACAEWHGSTRSSPLGLESSAIGTFELLDCRQSTRD